MPCEVASKIVALRPALEELIVKATLDPETVSQPDEEDGELMGLIRALSKPSAARFGINDPEATG